MVSHDKKIYYIRLFDNMLNSPEMNEIRTLPDGHKIVSFFISLLMYLKGSKTGVLEEVIAGKPIPISADKLRLELKYWNALEVETSLRVLNRYGFIFINNQMAFVVKNYKDIGGAETIQASYMRKIRESKSISTAIESNETKPKIINNVSNNVSNNVTKKGSIDNALSKESENGSINNVNNNVNPIVLDSMSVVQENKKSLNDDPLLAVEEQGKGVVNKQELYKSIINLYNNTCIKLPKIVSPESNHCHLINLLIDDGFTIEQFKKVFSKVASNEFFNGKYSKTAWRANLEWILNPTKFKKIINGDYDKWSKGVRPGIAERMSDIDRDIAYYAESYAELEINPLEQNIYYGNVPDEEYFTAIKKLPKIIVDEVVKMMDESKKYATKSHQRSNA